MHVRRILDDAERKIRSILQLSEIGNMNLKKVLEMNPSIMKAEKAKEKVEKPEIAKKQASREQTVRSDDMRYF